MTTIEQLDQALAARGWWYDAAVQQFKSSTSELHLKHVRDLVPGMTLDDLAEYQDDQYTQLCKRRVRPDVKTVYLIPAGTRVAISRDGVEYGPPCALKVQLQFSEPEPVEITDTAITFSDGPVRMRFDRADVIISRYDGQRGTNQFGV